MEEIIIVAGSAAEALLGVRNVPVVAPDEPVQVIRGLAAPQVVRLSEQPTSPWLRDALSGLRQREALLVLAMRGPLSERLAAASRMLAAHHIAFVRSLEVALVEVCPNAIGRHEEERRLWVTPRGVDVPAGVRRLLGRRWMEVSRPEVVSRLPRSVDGIVTDARVLPQLPARIAALARSPALLVPWEWAWSRTDRRWSAVARATTAAGGSSMSSGFGAQEQRIQEET